MSTLNIIRNNTIDSLETALDLSTFQCASCTLETVPLEVVHFKLSKSERTFSLRGVCDLGHVTRCTVIFTGDSDE